MSVKFSHFLWTSTGSLDDTLLFCFVFPRSFHTYIGVILSPTPIFSHLRSHHAEATSKGYKTRLTVFYAAPSRNNANQAEKITEDFS